MRNVPNDVIQKEKEKHFLLTLDSSGQEEERLNINKQSITTPSLNAAEETMLNHARCPSNRNGSLSENKKKNIK